MTDTKILPERQFLIENSLADYVGEWCAMRDARSTKCKPES